eukprot:403368720
MLFGYYYSLTNSFYSAFGFMDLSTGQITSIVFQKEFSVGGFFYSYILNDKDLYQLAQIKNTYQFSILKISQTNIQQQKWTNFNVTTPVYPLQFYSRVSEVDQNVRYHYVQCRAYNLNKSLGSIILFKENKGVLAGSIQGNQIGGQLNYSAKQGVSIDLPTPYYFSMGAPQLIQMYTVTQPEVTVLTQDLKSLPATIFKFIPSTRKLYVQSINKTVAGIYDLIYKCSVQDGFSNNQSFTINIKWDGRDLDPKPNTSTNTNTSTSLYLPNYAPQFYEKPRDIVIIAGAQASLTLPDYYDPNPNDKVTVKFETPERYKQYFRLQNQNTIVFDAGFPELGDQYLIITLKDNNPTNPKESKYLIKATFIQNDNFEMENSNVINVSIDNSTQQIYAFANYKSHRLGQLF